MSPSGQPSSQPSGQPSAQPSKAPSGQPSGQPSSQPTSPTGQPTSQPTSPTGQPSAQPSGQPSGQPSSEPTSPTGQPSSRPSGQPTSAPSNLAQNEALIASFSTDLVSATRSGSIAAVELVLNQLGSDSGSTNNVAYSALVTSIFDGHESMSSVLLEKAAIPLDVQGATGNTPLMWAAIWCKTIMLQSLLDKGAKYDLYNADNESALSLSKKSGCIAGTKILRKSGARF